MLRLAACTKILFAVMISAASLLAVHNSVLLFLCVIEGGLLFFVSERGFALKAGFLLMVFAALLYVVQLICGTGTELALLSALRMLVMALSITVMLFFTKNQEITAALVKQFHLPYRYAFMVTAVLRFVPDLLAESRSVREAQACRGYQAKGNPVQRMCGYMTIIKPMLFRAIERSSHMAVSLEMRGFSNGEGRTFMAYTRMQRLDYLCLLFAGIVFTAAFRLF